MGLFDKLRKKRNYPELYDEDEINILEQFIENTFGTFETVLHEIVSPDIHVDIAVIPPGDRYNYYTLVTMGMGAHKMNVPKELSDYRLERAEVVVCLPAEWKINSEEERWYWPIRWLKILARLPIDNDTWVGFGHTVSNGGAFAENTSLNSVMLIEPVGLKEYERLKLKNEEVINFYQMIPIYEEELNYKFDNNAEELLKKFEEPDLTHVVNLQRKNYCKPY